MKTRMLKEQRKHEEERAKTFSFKERVRVHPACDLWMMGARYGNVVKVTRTRVHVFLDATGTTKRFHPYDLLHDEE